MVGKEFTLNHCPSLHEIQRKVSKFLNISSHTCHISRREEKTHGITGFLTASRRETKTSRKEKNPMLKFSQGNNFADRYFSLGSRCCSNDYWAQRKADNKRNWNTRQY